MMDPVKLVTGAEMAAIDRRTIDTTEVTGFELMERAARAVVDAIASHWDGLDGLRVVVVCGKGNNGGDGFAVGRMLRQAGVEARIFLSYPASEIGGDAAGHLEKLVATGPVETLEMKGKSELKTAIDEADLVVDALLGTGTTGPPRDPAASIINLVVSCGKPVVAVDLPSGLDANSGRADGPCIAAALTVTFGLPKRGQLFFPGKSLCGILHLADIGFPADVVAQAPVSTYLLAEETVAALVPARGGDAHKGSCGTVAVLAGSVGMTGAAALTAEAALRAGAGRVVLGAPASINDILEVKLTEVMTAPLPEVRKRRCLALRSLGAALELADGAQVAAVGPGIGRHPETAELVRRLVVALDRPLVLDADGLNALVGHADILKERSTIPTVLTPHPAEFVRISEYEMKQVREDPVECGRSFATTYGVTLVLKGAPTVLALQDGAGTRESNRQPGHGDGRFGGCLDWIDSGISCPDRQRRRGIGAGHIYPRSSRRPRAGQTWGVGDAGR